MTDEIKPPDAERWAQLRLSIIGRLLARPPKRGELAAAVEELAGEHWTHPDDPHRRVRFHRRTIERWYYAARDAADPVAALRRKPRSDVGEARSVSAELLDKLEEQYRANPNWSYQLHTDNLRALTLIRPELGKAPSYSTVKRRMKENGWVRRPLPVDTAGGRAARRRLESREIRSYEASHLHELWHLDFHCCKRSAVDAAGRRFTPKLLCVLDDHSRLCCHIQWYADETAESLIHGLTQAIFRMGPPRALMTDNGSAMTAAETTNGLARLGVGHETTLPYSPYQNGKQETFWGQIEGRLMPMLQHVRPLTLKELNRATQAWTTMEYNHSRHSELGVSPIDRAAEASSVGRPSPEAEVAHRAFCARTRRKQRRSDGTVSIKSVRFEIPARFRHMDRLDVLYRSWDLSSAYVADPRTGDALARIVPTDKRRNADGRRRVLGEASAEAGTAAPAGPSPLLARYIEEYEAGGPAPGYLPSKKEMDSEQTKKGESDE